MTYFASRCITFLLSEEGRYLRRQLLLALTEDDRLHTAEVQRLWGLIQGELQPRRLLDVAMSEAAKSAWCREHGAYPAELDQWRAARVKVVVASIMQPSAEYAARWQPSC